MSSATLPNDAWISMGRDDANLNDLAVQSEDHVLAVGDRGLIVRSDSSGRKWQTLASPTTANLHGIRFSPLGFGLAVGGWIGSSTRMSHAVLLRSLDGGRSWQAIPAPSLPRLTGLRVQENRCLAWGDYSPLWRTSLFESLDGGQNWRGLRLTNSSNRVGDHTEVPIGHATAAELSSDGQVGAVDVLGRAYFSGPSSTAGNKVEAKACLATIAQPTQPLHALHYTGLNWLACGAKGELISSRDGQQWTNVELPLSPAARRFCHWQAITQTGDTLWVCGYPGSIVLTSHDCGATWLVKKTGQTLPLSAMHFVDENRGWATGPLGLMLATRDGGQTWYAQRQRARRLGVLAVSRSAQELPWVPLAAAAWDDQVAVAATLYQSIDPIAQADFLPSRCETYRDLAPQVGLAGISSQLSTEDSHANLSEKIALELRCWRPDVVLLGQQSVNRVGPEQDREPMWEIELLAALKNSAEAHTPISDELDLPAWSVAKLVSTCASEQSQYTEQISRLLRLPGIAIWDCLLPLPPADRATTNGGKGNTAMRTVWTQSQAKSAFTGLLGAVPANMENQRQVNIPNIGNFQLVMGRVHRDRSMEQLSQASTIMQPLEQWSSDLEFLMRSVPTRESSVVLQRLAQQLGVAQHWPQRKIVCQRLIDTEPQSDIADWARLELLTLDASDECAAWRRIVEIRTGELQHTSTSAMPLPNPGAPADSWGSDAGVQTASWNASPFGEVKPLHDSQLTKRSMVVSASTALPIVDPTSPTRNANTGPLINPNASSSRVQDAALFDANAGQLSMLEGEDSSVESHNAAWYQLLHAAQLQSPVLLARPDLELRQFRCEHLTPPMQQASDQGFARLERLTSTAPLIGWPQMAQQELRLLSGRTNDLRWRVAAASTNQPPVLDGMLDDAFWQRAKAMELTDFEATSQPTHIRWAYDQRYLYVGIVAPRSNTDAAPALVERREYDAELRGVDHVQLTLDTDRDYCTAIELGIAADGRTYDRCCDYAEYNPKWHVSVRSQAEQWTAELAIELGDLTTQTEVAGSAWAVSARRLQPDGSKQSWSQLRSHAAYLHAGGLLLFEARVDRE
ncbi:MAG: hypothetical protein ABI557_06940 [Aureliella sp.]